MGGKTKEEDPTGGGTSTPVFTSTFPELEGREFSSQAELDTAEEAILEQRRITEGGETLREGYRDLAISAATDPTSLVTPATIEPMQVTGDQVIDNGVGQVDSASTVASPTEGVSDVVMTPANIGTTTMTPSQATPGVQNIVDQMTTPEGVVRPEALAEAISKDPSQLAQLGLSPEQITQIRQVISPDRLQVTPEMMITGSAVDMAAVESAAQVEAAQADPSTLATVQGQLEQLYSDFDATSPPPWAAGAMRGATAKMAQRGLAASSMAGQAIVQAAMESALPIAMADAQTVAAFDAQNLSNRQQAALFGAQQRAEFLKMDFDQNFQTRVVNASRIADIAQINFTAEQQVALENARLAQTTDLANLEARNAKILSDAAAMSQLDLANLSNQQRVAVENAKSFLQMDLTNLNNQQQTELFKAQALQQSILSDTAAFNASAQFNAASKNQTTQFMAGLKAQVDQFNVTQANSMEQFNINEEVAVEQFNAAQENQRSQFNAQNSLIIAQANAKWRQDVSTINTATQNEANMEEVRTANAFTAKALDEMWQRERDLMQYAFMATESKEDRALELTLQNKEHKAENSAAMGGIFAKLLFGDL